MARPKKSEGAKVREAMDGPKFDTNELLSFIGARNLEDSERASDAATSRQQIGEFLEKTGINKKAMSWIRSLFKQKKQTDQADIIRSLKVLVPIAEQELLGNQPDFLEGLTSTEPEASAVEVAEELPATSYDPDSELFPDGDAEIQTEADDFDEQLAGVAQ